MRASTLIKRQTHKPKAVTVDTLRMGGACKAGAEAVLYHMGAIPITNDLPPNVIAFLDRTARHPNNNLMDGMYYHLRGLDRWRRHVRKRQGRTPDSPKGMPTVRFLRLLVASAIKTHGEAAVLPRLWMFYTTTRLPTALDVLNNKRTLSAYDAWDCFRELQQITTPAQQRAAFVKVAG